MQKELLFGLLIGGIAGATAGLLLAPKKGEELREDINDLYIDLNKQGHKAYKHAREDLEDWAHDAKKRYIANPLDKVSSIIEWAEAGVGLWNKLKR